MLCIPAQFSVNLPTCIVNGGNFHGFPIRFTSDLVGSRIEVPCAIRVLEVFKVFSYRFEDAESNERG